MTRRRPLTALLLAALFLGAPASALAAEQFAGLTSDNQIMLFRSDSPGKIQGAAFVTGLEPAEVLLGIDAHPSTGILYGLGSTNRVYAVDPVTGHANPLSNTPFSPPLNGQTFTFAIDASTNQARVVSDTGQDIRVSIVNGQVAGVDSPYTYVADDPGTGTTPLLSALAYTLPPAGSPGAPSLYGIDSARDALVTAPTFAATVRTIGPLGVEVAEPAALDIGSEGEAFAALRRQPEENPQLYSVDLSTGTAVPATADPSLATIAPRTSSRGNTDTPIISMAALGQVGDDSRAPRVVVDAQARPTFERFLRRGLGVRIACSEACTTQASLTVRGVRTEAEGSVVATAGNVRLRLRPDREARELLRERPGGRVVLRVDVTDAAGNEIGTRRRIRPLAPVEE